MRMLDRAKESTNGSSWEIIRDGVEDRRELE